MKPMNNITCPHCKKSFELSEAISHDLNSQVEEKLQSELQKHERAYKDKIAFAEKERADLQARVERETLELRSKAEKEKAEFKARAEKERADLLLKSEKERADFQAKAEKDRADLQAKAEKDRSELLRKSEAELQAIRIKIETETTARASQKFLLETEDLKNQLKEKEKLVETSQAKELELLKKERAIEQKARDFELELQRKLTAERSVLMTEVKMQADQESSLKIAEKDKELNDLKGKIDELKRKSQVVSQQLQGEVLEIQAEEILFELFPEDEISEIKKGAKGADILQHVKFAQSGRTAGVILYECKRTNDWKDTWITKLKEDMRESSATIGVIISSHLPKEVKLMGVYDGVWVCTPSMMKPLAQLLREGLIRGARAEVLAATSPDQRDFLFKYMTSPKFTQKIQAMCEVTIAMKQSLDKERRSLTSSWKRREQEIETMETQMVNLYGELQGVVGKALPSLGLLELGYEDGE